MESLRSANLALLSFKSATISFVAVVSFKCYFTALCKLVLCTESGVNLFHTPPFNKLFCFC
jgi:hypothetical protein